MPERPQDVGGEESVQGVNEVLAADDEAHLAAHGTDLLDRDVGVGRHGCAPGAADDALCEPQADHARLARAGSSDHREVSEVLDRASLLVGQLLEGLPQPARSLKSPQANAIASRR